MKRIIALLLTVLMLSMCTACGRNDNKDIENTTSTITTPDIVGMQVEQAKKTIKDSGLEVGNIEYVDDIEGSEDTVVKQEPNSGDPINAGEEVDMTVKK